MNADQTSELKLFYNALKDEPLEPSDPRYVEGVHEPHDVDLLQNLPTSIAWNDGGSVHLFSGQRGSGKSTELRRLRTLLEGKGYTVFLVDMNEYSNLGQPMDKLCFLLSITIALDDLVPRGEGSGGEKPTGAIRWKKSKIRQLFRQRSPEKDADISKTVHSIVAELITESRKAHNDKNRKFVFLVDSVEHISGIANDAYKSENLFGNDSADLCFDNMHVVYTVPSYLIPLTPSRGRHLGGNAMVTLPNIPVRGIDGRPNPKGLASVREMISRRYKNWSHLFAEVQLDRIILASGGDLNCCYRFIRLVLTICGAQKEADLPVPDLLITRAEGEMRREMLPLSGEDLVWLKQIAENHLIPSIERDQLPRLARLFDDNLIQHFRNSEDWYDVHPLIKSHLTEKATNGYGREYQLPVITNLPKLRLVSLAIKNVKCFNGIKVDLNGDPSLFMGINGRGKSTLLQLPALALAGLAQPPDPANWTRVVKADKENAKLEITIELDGAQHDLHFSVDPDDRLTCVKGQDIYKQYAGRLMVLAYGAGRNIKRDDVVPNKRFEKIASLFGNNAYLKNIKDSEVYALVSQRWDWIRDQLNQVLALADENHKVEILRYDARGFYFQTATDPQGNTPLEAMSDGFRATFVWLFDLLVRAAEMGITQRDQITGLVLIDEVDLHLHPTWQRTLLPVLQRLFTEVQFLVTSHSPFVVQSWQNPNVFLLKSQDDGVTVSRMEGDGRPFGHEIESIINETIALENAIPSISDRLFNMMVEFDKAVENRDGENVHRFYDEIDAAIPTNSGYRQYLEMMSKGFLGEKP